MAPVELRLMLKIAGEIGTKSSRPRRRFLRVLAGNVRAALGRARVRGRVEPRWSRLMVETEDLSGARTSLTEVFGLHSIAEVATVGFEALGDLVAGAAELYRDGVAGRTYAVRVRRAGRQSFDSL